ncbi:MAG: protein-glutamate O-methyltransferase CheR [Dehalococcoidia bacterium]
MPLDDQAFSYLKRQINELLDIDIDAYKTRQMRRRLETFVDSKLAGASPMVFLRLLSSDEQMLAELRDMLTINVSEFFRDKPQFDMLEEQVLPDLLRGEARFRVWSAGCSYGHEPYSLAMMFDAAGAARRCSILATDFDRRMLARAKAGGPYPTNEMRNVAPERREQYFEERDGSNFIKRALTARVNFQELNLLKDDFQQGFHLVLCRNVMIYFSVEVKLALIQRFWDSLRPGGVLFIGATETLLGKEAAGFDRIGGNFYLKPENVEVRISRQAA